MVSENQQTARVFKAFCDENRIEVLRLLRNGEQCACKLQEALSIGQSTLSHHMRILCDSGVVDARKEGKWTYYTLNVDGGRAAVVLLEQVLDLRKGG